MKGDEFTPWPKPGKNDKRIAKERINRKQKHLTRSKPISKWGLKRLRKKLREAGAAPVLFADPSPPPASEKPQPTLRRSPYLHPEWLALRAVVMLRAAGGDPTAMARCEHCHRHKATSVHHLAYAPGRGWRRLIVPLECLLATCKACHDSFHPHMTPFGPGKGIA